MITTLFLFVSSHQQIAKLTATPNLQASIDDEFLETDPRIIIRKLLRALPDETDAPALAVSSPSILKADEINYNGDSDVDSKDELIDAIFGDETPTPYFVPCSGNRQSDVINAVQTPTSTPSSSGSSQFSIDDGYDGDDDFDAIDDIADSVFGSVTPTRYFFPAHQDENNSETGNKRDISLRPFALPDISCGSGILPLSSSESESEQKPRKFASTTNGDDDLGVIPLHFEPISDHSYDDETVDDAESLMSDDSSRSSIDNEESGESETDTVSVDTLKEMAIAISKVMSDLEVIEIHKSVNVENEFSVCLMEVRPWALPGAPTLFAYKGCDQITVPLEMVCNQYAAGIIREMAEAGNLVSIPSEQTAPSLNKVGLLLDEDAFNSSSEVGIDSEFESCDEEELMALITPSRARKRGRDDVTDFENNDNDTEDAMRTPSNSRQPRKRSKL